MDEQPVIRRTTRGESVGDVWLSVTRGARRHRDAEDAHVAELHAWQAVLPEGAVFTHLTAARLAGWWLPPLPADLPVFVALPESSPRVRRPGLVTLRRRATAQVDEVAGLRVDPAAQALLMASRTLGRLDLTCLVTSALRSGGCTLDDVIASALPRVRGGPRLREAASRADPRAESIWEVLLRELHDAVEMPVEPQYDVCDADGSFVARGDLWIVGTQELHEYDGEDHLTRRRQRKDHARDRRLARAGWVRRAYTREDVLHSAVAILRDADAAIGREHDPRRVRAWHELLRTSLFTPAGTQLVRRRLGLSPTGHAETR